MKKWITCFFTVCLLAVALSVTAFAAGTVETVTSGTATLEKNGTEKVNVTYGSAEPGKEYLVLATNKEVTPAGLKAEDIVYIDQKTAEGTSVSFTVYPKELKTQAYYVYMSSNASSGITALQKVGTYTAEGPAYTPGDLNDDGRVRANDATLALRGAAGLETLTETQTLAADVNGDGRVRANDATMILRFAAGLITSFD